MSYEDTFLRVCVLIGFVIFVSVCVFTSEYYGQWKTDRKRKLAHAGKVTCENEREVCTNIATRVTPNGYFCDIHWSENSRHPSMKGAVSWSHILNHKLKENA